MLVQREEAVRDGHVHSTLFTATKETFSGLSWWCISLLDTCIITAITFRWFWK